VLVVVTGLVGRRLGAAVVVVVVFCRRFALAVRLLVAVDDVDLPVEVDRVGVVAVAAGVAALVLISLTASNKFFCSSHTFIIRYSKKWYIIECKSPVLVATDDVAAGVLIVGAVLLSVFSLRFAVTVRLVAVVDDCSVVCGVCGDWSVV
jgi:hypothetical protein